MRTALQLWQRLKGLNVLRVLNFFPRSHLFLSVPPLLESYDHVCAAEDAVVAAKGVLAALVPADERYEEAAETARKSQEHCDEIANKLVTRLLNIDAHDKEAMKEVQKLVENNPKKARIE